MKRMLPTLLAALLLVSVFAPVAVAAESATSGTCGEGISWSYSNYTLTISGEGEMADGSPWEAYKDRIETVILTGGITKIGESAFENYDSLEKIDFGDALVEIGKRAFYDCNDIVEIRLPKTFKRFGEESFRNCQSLERVICEGGMPSFKSSCLYTGNYISVFYPPNNPWSSEYYGPVISSYGGMLGFMMASEDIMNDIYVFETKAEETSEEETTAETQATEEKIAVVAEDVTEATEAKVAIVAQDVTEATVPVTTVPTMPSTTLPPATDPTVAPTIEVETIEATQLRLFEETTEPAQEEKEKGSFLSSSWMGIIMIAGVLTFVLAGVMIMRNNRHKGGRFGE